MDITRMKTESFSFELKIEKLQIEDLRELLEAGAYSTGPAREESLMPSWPAPNWIVEGNRIRHIRSRAEERERRRKMIIAKCGSMDPYVLIQNPCISILAFGDWQWTDYELHARFSGGIDGTTGIAFRYQNARHYYALTIQRDEGMKLVLRVDDEHNVMAQASIGEARNEYHVVISVKAGKLEARLIDGPVISASDGAYSYGKAAFICEGESTFGTARANGRTLRTEDFPVPEAPEMNLLAEGALAAQLTGSRTMFGDVDGDGMPELISDADYGNEVHCQHIERGYMWQLGPFEHSLSQGGALPLQAFDIDGDGVPELVFTADFGIHVHNATTGEHKATVDAPKANPYRDSADYEYERLLGDAMYPVITEPGKPPGFYVKDRYTNIWLYDNKLNLLWHRAINTGHCPLPIQLKEGEPDYIFASRSLLSPTGETVWELGLPDHSDAIGFFTLDAEKRLYVAAGEEGFLEIEPKTGKIATQLKWGHVQHYSLGKFMEGRPDHQILSTTFWREPGIVSLLDERLNLVQRWDEMSYDLTLSPIPWSTSGNDLVAGRGGIRDPLSGRMDRPYPEKCGRVRQILVADLPGYGRGCLLMIGEDSWQIWGPGKNVPTVTPRSRPNALNIAGYLPILSF